MMISLRLLLCLVAAGTLLIATSGVVCGGGGGKEEQVQQQRMWLVRFNHPVSAVSKNSLLSRLNVGVSAADPEKNTKTYRKYGGLLSRYYPREREFAISTTRAVLEAGGITQKKKGSDYSFRLAPAVAVPSFTAGAEEEILLLYLVPTLSRWDAWLADFATKCRDVLAPMMVTAGGRRHFEFECDAQGSGARVWWFGRQEREQGLDLEERLILLRLAQHPNVLGMDWDMKMELKNHESQWIVQSRRPDKRPLWDRGIRGQGQVVGVADTGIDVDHCLFFDPNHTVIAAAENPDHRKILLYDRGFFGDWSDDVAGHGTHVAASIAGSLSSSSSTEAVAGRYEGVAPEAKLAFFDMGINGRSGLRVPTLSAMFDATREHGGWIHSNSWGCGSDSLVYCNQYSYQARAADQYAWDHPDFLIVIAAGNDGESEESASMSVGAPATAKNVLSIGASQTSNKGFRRALDYINWDKRQEAKREELNDPDFDCCSVLSTAKAHCCKSSWYSSLDWFPGDYNEENIGLFSSRGPTSDGRVAPALVCPGEYVVSANGDGLANGQEHCGDMTPEQNATSASLTSKRGTSMATPICAGALTLIRQYLVDGWFDVANQRPSADGRPDPVANSVTPSSALLKAMAVFGAQALSGAVNLQPSLWPVRNMVPVGEVYPPTVFQGFGAMNLERTLPFFSGGAGSSSPDDEFNLFLWDLKDRERDGLESNETHYFCVHGAAAATPLKVSLVWTDFPAQVGAERAAVNDLDLYVGTSLEDVEAGNFKVRRDARNNVELVVFEQTLAAAAANAAAVQPPPVIQILVRGYDVPMGPQGYALVVGGQFDSVSVDCASPSSGPSPTPIQLLVVPYSHFNETTDADHFPEFHRYELWKVIAWVVAAAVVVLVYFLASIDVCLHCTRKQRPCILNYYLCWPCNSAIARRNRRHN